MSLFDNPNDRYDRTTAANRGHDLRARIAAAEEFKRCQIVSGFEHDFMSPLSRYIKMMRAELDFADAQLRTFSTDAGHVDSLEQQADEA